MIKRIRIFIYSLLSYTVLYVTLFFYFYKYKSAADINAVWYVFWFLNFPIMMSNYVTYTLFKVPVVATLAHLIYPISDNNIDLGIHYYLEGVIGYGLLFVFILIVIQLANKNKTR